MTGRSMQHARTPLLDSAPMKRYGLPELVYGDTPPAATDFTQAMVGQFFTRLLTVFCHFVSDANAASREVVLEYRDQQQQRFVLAGAPVTVSAGETHDFAYSCFQGQAEWPIDSSVLVPLPPLVLPPGFDFRLHIVNAQAGDQLSRIRFMWERFYSDVDIPTHVPGYF